MSQPILDVSENWFCRLVSRFRAEQEGAAAMLKLNQKRSDNTRVVLLQKSLRVLQKSAAPKNTPWAVDDRMRHSHSVIVLLPYCGSRRTFVFFFCHYCSSSRRTRSFPNILLHNYSASSSLSHYSPSSEPNSKSMSYGPNCFKKNLKISKKNFLGRRKNNISSSGGKSKSKSEQRVNQDRCSQAHTL